MQPRSAVAYTRTVGPNRQRVCGAALLLLWFIAPAPARAADYRIGDLVVAQPWSRPTPPVATVGAVYFSLTNVGRKADRLIAISSPNARKVEMHESRSVQGMMQMRAVESVECLPGVTVKSEPMGLHVMLLDLLHPLVAGEEFPLMLHFRDAGTLTIQVQVGARE
jgi:periplasmic copper chaperone A